MNRDSVACPAGSAQPLPRTNTEFLAAIFSGSGPARPRVTGFAGHPKDEANRRNWAGRPWSPGTAADGPGLNWYFTLAVFEGRRKNAAAARAIHGIMLDDIGTKAAPLSRLDPCPPSIVVETSPGNFQAFYLFAEPATDHAAVGALLAQAQAAGLCDPGATSPETRWCRLPFGVNGKHEPPAPCSLVAWHPERRFTIDQIRQGLGLAPAAPPPPRAPVPVSPSTLTEAEKDTIEVELRSALEVIPADCIRDDWIAIGHALRHFDYMRGFAMFEAWSRTGHMYEEGDETRFFTFDPTRTSYKAIFTRAQALGWRNPRAMPAASVVFATPAPLPPGASRTPLPAPPPRDRPHVMLIPDDPLTTARELIGRWYSHAGQPTLKFWKGSFYRWSGAAWSEFPDADVRAAVYAFIDRYGIVDFKPTARRVSDVIDALRADANLEARYAPPCWIDDGQHPPAAEIIGCANGVLHLPTRTLHPASPLLFNVNASPFDFDPATPPPARWLEFLSTVWPNDPEAIATLQEVFGYLLTPDTKQQKLFLIVGPKRSGKGTIARVLTDMLGKDNVAAPTLSGMGTQFGLASLVGKLAAIVSDARIGGRADPKVIAENLLRVSGEDRVEIDRKNRDPVTLTLGVRFLLLTNELPRIADASGAMASRFIVLTMSESFFGREDPGLTAKLLPELPGVLAWAVEGWHRLRARGYFTPPRSSAEAVQDLADLGSPISAFLRDECTTGPTAEVEVGELFTAWRAWCLNQGISHTGDKQAFGRDLKAALPGLTNIQPRIGGERVRAYRGIGLARGGTRANALQRLPAEVFAKNT